jgi:putative addiction module killer protein
LEATPREILVCQDEAGREPFTEWLNALDLQTRARVRVRIDRLEDGLFGDVEPVGEGVSELRLDFGPGYRVYFGQIGLSNPSDSWRIEARPEREYPPGKEVLEGA